LIVLPQSQFLLPPVGPSFARRASCCSASPLVSWHHPTLARNALIVTYSPDEFGINVRAFPALSHSMRWIRLRRRRFRRRRVSSEETQMPASKQQHLDRTRMSKRILSASTIYNRMSAGTPRGLEPLFSP